MANHHKSGDKSGDNSVREVFRRAELFRQFSKMSEAMIPSTLLKVGPQNDYPQGMYGKNDEGAIAFSVGADRKNEKVVVDYGSAVTSIAMDPQQAIHFAELLIKSARKAARSATLLKVELT